MHSFQSTLAVLLALIVPLTSQASAADEAESPPKTAGIVEALAEYQEAVDQAKAAFLKKLRDAERNAARDKDAEETAALGLWVKRLAGAESFPEFDPLAAARSKVAGTTWSFDRPAKRETNRMTFHKSGIWQTSVPQKGHWILATERMVICSFRGTGRDEVFVFDFDEDYKNYDVRAFGDIPTKFVAGRRLK
jgi:hypothetical protein